MARLYSSEFRYLLVLERKTRGRQLHLAKRRWICFVPFFSTEEGPFRAKMFCQVKLSTTCLTLQNQQIPIYRRGNESLLYEFMCVTLSLLLLPATSDQGTEPVAEERDL